ncbi:unnamed protein product [Heterobilharzia americana]|nr:unnamed protein product [Heterobilharzia americana]
MRRVRRPFPNTHSINPHIHDGSTPHNHHSSVSRLDEEQHTNLHHHHHHYHQQHQHTNESNSSTTPVNNSIISDQSNEFTMQNSTVSYTDESYLNLLNTLNDYTTDNSNEYKYTRVIKAIREVISCCACYTSDTLMKECMNGHLICQNCFLTLRQDERPQCPTCRANLYSDTRRALIAQKVLSELPDTCSDCKTPMLHKSLTNHRLNLCPKRRVACGLSPFGCDWIGSAEQYHQNHQNECMMRKRLLEQPIGDHLDTLLNSFHIREQSMRETFQCFSTVLHHLEAHELQTISVTLSSINVNETDILYRSDNFHLNQSRWTVEALVKFTPEQTPSNHHDNISQPYTSEQSTIQIDLTTSNLSLPSTNIEQNECSIDEVTDHNHHHQQQQSLTPSAIRRRRNHSCVFSRHHPYQRSFSGTQNHSFTCTENLEQSNIPIYEHMISPRVSPISTPNWNGDITFRLIKENSPGIGRKVFSFVFLQLRVPESGVHIYARPQLHTYRFNIRGEHTPYYKILPIRWRYINDLREMIKYRLIQVEIIIARRIAEEHSDN